MKKYLAFVFLLLSWTSLHAQIATSGSLVGSVTDISGASVPNAEVIATNRDTGVATKTKSNGQGQYRINSLPFGFYTVTVNSAGFATSTVNNFEIQLNKVSTLPVQLALAGAQTSLNVSSEASVALDTTSIQLTQTFSGKELQDLPTATYGLSGVLNLSLLSPGVASTGGIGIGTGPSVGGQRPRNNNFMIEGVDNNDKSITGPLVYVPNAAVGEFTLITNQFAPEFGHSSGGQFNTNIVSGTNKFHGQVYEYFQNRNLNAIDAANTRGLSAEDLASYQNPRYDFNRWGGQIGGPVLHDKLFFFSNFERQSLGQNINYQLCSPTAATYTALNNATGYRSINLAQLQKYLPAGTGTTDQAANVCGTPTITSNGQDLDIGTYTVNSPIYHNYYASTNSIDYAISDSDRLRFRYIYNRFDDIDDTAELPTFWTSVPNRYHLFTLSEYHTFTPNLVNEFRLGYNRHYQDYSAGNQSFPGLDSFPNIYLNDLFVDIGPDDNAPQSTVQNNYQVTDNITWTKGKHTLVIGFDGRKLIAPQTFTQRVRGDYEWNNTEEYLQDLSPTYFGERSTGNFVYYGDQTQLYGYVNDVYRMTEHVTLNAGLRYEFTSVPVGMRQQSLNSAASVPGLVNFGAPQPQYKNFAPRVGVAWAPGDKGEWSIRAGFSMAYDVLFDNLGLLSLPPQYSSTTDVNTNNSTPNFLANGGLPTGTGQLATFDTVADQRAATGAWIPDQRLPYAETYSFSIQHVIDKAYTVEVGYLGSRGLHLPIQIQLNRQNAVTATRNLPTYTTSTPSTATLDSLPWTVDSIQNLNANGQAINGFDPTWAAAGFGPTGAATDESYYSNITSYLRSGGSSYNSLRGQLTRRFQQGLQVNVAYTWSKLMDNSTAEVFSTTLTPRRPQTFNDPNGDYSRSALDRTHRLTAEAMYDLPYFKTNSNWALKNILSNWEVGTIYTYESPQPMTLQSNVDSNLNGDPAGDRVIYNPNGIKGTGSGVTALANTAGDTVAYQARNPNAEYIVAGPGSVTNVGRNSVTFRPIDNLDVTALKRVSFGDRYAFEFQAQAFNVINHAQYVPGYISDVAPFSTSSSSYKTLLIPGNANFLKPQNVFSSNPRTMQLAAKFIF